MNALLTAAAVSLLTVSAAASENLSLRQAAAEALENNPRLVASRAGTSAAQARLGAARAAWLPVIDATANSTRSNNPVFVFGSLLEQGRFGAQNFDPVFLNDPPVTRNDRLSLNLRYTLFDQLRRYDVTAAMREGVNAARSAEQETSQQVLADVIDRYYGVSVAAQRERVAAEAVRAAESAAKAARDKAEQGLAVDSDRLAAEVQLAQFRQQQIEAAGEAAVARGALALAMHRPIVKAEFDVAALPDKTFPAIDLDTAADRAVEQRGETAAAAAQRKSATLDLRTARGSLLPRVDAFASWGASGSTFDERDSDRTYGVVLNLALFDPARFARIREARAGESSARAMENAVRDRVTMETLAAWHRANAAREQVEVARVAAEQATAAARIIQDRYENGLTTITEALRAQTALYTAQLGLISVRHRYITGYAELLRAIGGLYDIEPFL